MPFAYAVPPGSLEVPAQVIKGWNLKINGTPVTLDADGRFTFKQPLVAGSNKFARVNGEIRTMVAPARMVDGRTLVPVRFVSESLGAKVEWFEETESIVVTMQ